VPITDFMVHDGLLAVQQTSEGRRTRVALEGEMDLANVETAASTLREALQGSKDVVIDLRLLAFLDSTGIAMLIAAMREGGERVSFLPSKNDSVCRLFSLTGLDERMKLASPALVGLRTEDADAEPLLPAA
jgi:anti-anti-sigma factor